MIRKILIILDENLLIQSRDFFKDEPQSYFMHSGDLIISKSMWYNSSSLHKIKEIISLLL